MWKSEVLGMPPSLASPAETSMDNAVINSWVTKIPPLRRYWVKCGCTSRDKTFAVAAADFIFDAEHISHGQSTAAPFCSTLLQWKLKYRVSITLVSGENFCCACGSLWLNSFRLFTPGHVAGWFVNPLVPTNFVFLSSQASSDALASFFVRPNNFEMTYLTSRT